jgi:hypothetical protein
MLILYDLRTKEIVGVSLILNDSSGNVPQPTIRTTFPTERTVPNIGYYIAPDDELVANEISKYMLRYDSRGNPKGLVRKPAKPYIHLSTDASDYDADGISEIIADGKDTATIVASIRDETGRVIADKSYMVRFATSGGILSAKAVRSETGIAKTVLTSVPETIRVTVTASANGCYSGKLELDFIPAEAKHRRRAGTY